MFRAGGNSNRIDRFNYNSIPELKRELEFKDLEQLKLEMIFLLIWNSKILNWIGIE